MKDASILGDLRGMLVDEIHGLRFLLSFSFSSLMVWFNSATVAVNA